MKVAGTPTPVTINNQLTFRPRSFIVKKKISVAGV